MRPNKGHHSNAENVASFDDTSTKQKPSRIGNPLAGHPTRYTNPPNPGSAKPTVSADGTENMRVESKTFGPTPPPKAGAGQQAWPKDVDHFEEGDV